VRLFRISCTSLFTLERRGLGLNTVRMVVCGTVPLHRSAGHHVFVRAMPAVRATDDPTSLEVLAGLLGCRSVDVIFFGPPLTAIIGRPQRP
jgi:hypothetical protein